MMLHLVFSSVQFCLTCRRWGFKSNLKENWEQMVQQGLEREELIFWWYQLTFSVTKLFMLQSKLQSDAMTSWSWQQKYEREGWIFNYCLFFNLVPWDKGHSTKNMRGNLVYWVYVFIWILKSVLQSTTELAHAGYIYSVLCTSHCFVFYNVPPLMGQVLGKVLLTSWEIN